MNQISALTGRDRRTLAARLADVAPVRLAGRVRYYAAEDALRACKSAGTASPKSGALADVRLARERERLRAERVAADMAEGKVVEKDIGRQLVTRCINQIKHRVLQIPARLAQRFAIETDPVKIELTLNSEIRSAWQTAGKEFIKNEK